MKEVELLAPAGDEESLRASLRFGANAVYIGGEMLQLRSDQAAFDRHSLVNAVAMVHQAHRKLYVTVNSFPTDRELELLPEYSLFLQKAGVDAVIVSDLGSIAVIKKAAPDLAIHVSTQANCCNSQAATVYYQLGAQRVVLAREMTLEQIARLRDKTPPDLELEAFVHGAMCMAYSGRCLISSYLNGRSGNRGECTQPCRWGYALMEQKRPGEYFPVEENNGKTAILSSHDLCCIDFLDQIANAGVSSFKIEGRMKSANYVATVVNAYRHAIDGDVRIDLLKRELNSVSHRPFSSGFYFGREQTNPYNDGVYRSDCRFVAVVMGKSADGYIVQQRNRFSVGDELERVSPDTVGEKVRVLALFNEAHEPVTDAKLVEEKLTLVCDSVLEPGDILRLRISSCQESF